MGKPQKHKRNQISFCPILGPCPTLGTVASGKFSEYWATFYLHKDDKTTASVWKYDIKGMSYILTSVPFWEQQAPSYRKRRSGHTSENFYATHTH